VGARLYRPDLEENGSVNATLDRLASLLRIHPPDRLATFWGDAMKEEQEERDMLSAAIARAIEESGLNQYQLGKKSGISPSTIRRFMSRERDLRLPTAGKLAEALDLVLIPRPKK
jgi:hypothetical protein